MAEVDYKTYNQGQERNGITFACANGAEETRQSLTRNKFITYGS